MGWIEVFDWSATAEVALGVAFYAPVGVLALVVLGLLWAAPGALVLASIARLRGLGAAAQYASAGAKASALMFLPWVYMFVKLAFGKPPPSAVVKAAYALAGAAWLSAIAGNAAFLANYVYYLMASQERSVGLGALGMLLFGSMLAGGVYTFRMSMKRARDKSKAHESAAPRNAGLGAVLPDKAYLAPFGWLIGWSIGFLFAVQMMLFLGFVADVSA